MKNPITFYLVLFVSVLLISCSKKNKSVLTPSPSFDIANGNLSEGEVKAEGNPISEASVQPYVIASLQKNGCFGKCPEYELIILSNGNVTFHGKKHMTLIGTYHSIVPKGFSLELQEKVNAANYFDLEKMYPPDGKFLKDLPDTYSMVNVNGNKLIIRNNHDAPKSLLEFEKYLEGLIEKLDWEKVKD